MSILSNLAKDMIAKKLGANSDVVGDAMGSLLGNDAEGGFDIASIVSGLKDKGLGDVASSWLGDGENAEISLDQVKDVIGGDKITEAAAKLGTDEGSLLEGLASALPQLIDKSSSGGSLIESVGGLGGLGGLGAMAKKFL